MTIADGFDAKVHQTLTFAITAAADQVVADAKAEIAKQLQVQAISMAPKLSIHSLGAMMVMGRRSKESNLDFARRITQASKARSSPHGAQVRRAMGILKLARK